MFLYRVVGLWSTIKVHACQTDGHLLFASSDHRSGQARRVRAARVKGGPLLAMPIPSVAGADPQQLPVSLTATTLAGCLQSRGKVSNSVSFGDKRGTMTQVQVQVQGKIARYEGCAVVESGRSRDVVVVVV